LTGIGDGEVNDLLARLVDAEGQHEIELADIEAGNEARPFAGNELASDGGALAEILGEIDVEARELAVGADHVPRREGALDAEPDMRPILGTDGAGGKCRRQCEDDGEEQCLDRYGHGAGPRCGRRSVRRW
jgi:hypothetical protein